MLKIKHQQKDELLDVPTEHFHLELMAHPTHVNTKRKIDALKRGKRFYDAFQRVSSMKRIETQLENF